MLSKSLNGSTKGHVFSSLLAPLLCLPAGQAEHEPMRPVPNSS
jgi:hypothetical protein